MTDSVLHRLAEAHGVGTSFRGFDGRERRVAPDTLVKILAALGISAGTEELAGLALTEVETAPWRRMLPPAVVVVENTAANVSVHIPHGRPARLNIRTEDGTLIPAPQLDRWVDPRLVDGKLVGRATFEIPPGVPLGWHTLAAESDDRHAEAALVVVPGRLSTADPLAKRRGWGLSTQLYSVRSERSWGVGDFADLAELAAITGAQGGDYVLVNPLHAAEPVPPLLPSPYSPSTRSFFNPLYIRIEAVPEYAYLPAGKRAEMDRLAAQARASNTSADLLDRDPVYAAKLAALETLYQVRRTPSRRQAFSQFCRRAAHALDDFALWCALREDTGPADPLWQSLDAAPDSAFMDQQRQVLAPRIDFHRWLQWICDEQLESAQRSAKSAGMRLGVVHDLAVGADLSSADAWTLRSVLAPGVSVGAPPDMYNQLGQDWNQPPWHPRRLAEAGYAPFRDMLRNVLRHAGGIRVDHILGLFRLWWVPAGNTPDQGAYVRYDHAALIGILALEAQRAGAVVIGEDLGVFEPWVRDYLAERGILGTSILWFEYDDGGAPLPPEKYREGALSSVNTHDLPPTAGFLAGDHVALRAQLGLLERSEAQERADHAVALDGVLALARDRGLLPADGPQPSAGQVIEALYRLLARSPSVLLGVALVDAVGERRTQNQPGTTAAQYPNWRIPLADGHGRTVLIEDLEREPRFASLLAAVQEAVGNAQRPGARV